MKKIRKIRFMLFLGSLVSALLGMLFANLKMIPLTTCFLFLAFSGIIGNIIYTLMFWHCPHCQRLLPTKGNSWAEYCPYCGKKLDEEEG